MNLQCALIKQDEYEAQKHTNVILKSANIWFSWHTHTHTTILRLCGNCPGQPG